MALDWKETWTSISCPRMLLCTQRNLWSAACPVSQLESWHMCACQETLLRKVPEFGDQTLPALSAFEATHGPVCPATAVYGKRLSAINHGRKARGTSVTTGKWRCFHVKELLTPTPPQGSLTNTEVREPVGRGQDQWLGTPQFWGCSILKWHCGTWAGTKSNAPSCGTAQQQVQPLHGISLPLGVEWERGTLASRWCPVQVGGEPCTLAVPSTNPAA